MTTRATFPSRTGSEVTAELSEPQGSGKGPAVVLLQEWWGVNDHVKSLVTRLSAEGLLALAPDLYHGFVTKDAGEAAKRMNALDTMAAMDDVAGAVRFAKEHPRSNGKVCVMGFCMGGALTFAASCHVPGLAAAVSFYGVPMPEKVDYTKVTAPVQAHVAKHDEWVTVAKVEAIKAQLDARKHPMEMFVYDAQHAFVNDTRPDVYDAANAKLAWDRAVAFMKKHAS